MFYRNLNPPILKVARHEHESFDYGYCEVNIPVVEGYHVM